jgi:hypothetical protein
MSAPQGDATSCVIVTPTPTDEQRDEKHGPTEPFHHVRADAVLLNVIEVPLVYLLHEPNSFRSQLLQGARSVTTSPEAPSSDRDDVAVATVVPGNNRLRSLAISTILAIYSGERQFRGFVADVAFRAVFDHVYHEQPTGDIVVMDVLLSVFLWLEPAQATLLAVSHVSRAWREASAHLPQWSVTHQLMHPSPPIPRVHFVAAYRAPQTDIATVHGFDVRTRRDYMTTMQVRPAIRERFLWMRRRQSAVRCVARCCVSNSAVSCLNFVVVAGLLSLVFFVIFQIGYQRGLRLGSDAVVGSIGWVVSATMPAVLIGLFLCLIRCLCTFGAVRRFLRQRSLIPFIITAVSASLALGCAVALVAARIAQATNLAEAPRVVFSTAICSDPSHFGFNDRPMYVQLENPWEWRIEPWAAGGPAAVDNRTNGSQVPLCRVPPAGRAPRTWWADTYLGNQTLLAALQLEFNESFAQADGIQCTDRLVTSQLNRYDFLMLYPPAELVAACPTATPLALAYDPTRADFNDTVGALWSSSADAARAAGAGKLTSFRTAVETTWFNVPWAHEAGAAWFAASEAALNGSSTALRYNESAVASAYLWERRRIPLVVPVVVPSPEDLKASWWIREYAFFGTAAAVMVLTLFFALTPRRCLSNSCLIVWTALVTFAAANPLWLLIWGAVCSFGNHPGVCLMGHGSAVAIFVIGCVYVFSMFVMCGKTMAEE